MLGAEEQLILAIFFLYGYSCSLSVLPHEIYFEVSKHKRKLLFPQMHLSLFKKDLLFVNPFSFYKAIIALPKTSSNVDKEFRKRHFQLRFLNRCLPFVTLIWLLTLVAIPLSLILSNVLLLISFGVVLYATVMLFILFLWFYRRVLKLTVSQLVTLSFEFLVCPPFAANGIKYLSLELK